MHSILRFIAVIVLSAFAFIASAAQKNDEALKVLAIGNSFSVCVLKEMPKIATDLGCKLDFCSMYIGGCTLGKHAGNLNKTNASPYSITWSYVSCEQGSEPFKDALTEANGKYYSNIVKMLKADKWNVVTIQQGSHQSWRPGSYEPHGTMLINAIKKHAPQAKIYVQQTWSYTPWDNRLKKWGIDQNQMFDGIEKAYGEFAKSHGLDLILTGKAIQLFRKELPVKYTENSNADDVVGVNKFKKLENGKYWISGDPFHLNKKGVYFQALVWTAKLFGADVTKCNYVPEHLKKAPETVDLMKKIACEVAKQK